MAAITTLFETVDTGHIIAPTVMYHGAQDWLRRISTRRGIGLTLFDAKDPNVLSTALRPGEWMTPESMCDVVICEYDPVSDELRKGAGRLAATSGCTFANTVGDPRRRPW